MNLDQDLYQNHSTLGAVVPLPMFYTLFANTGCPACSSNALDSSTCGSLDGYCGPVGPGDYSIIFTFQKGVGSVLLKSSHIFSSNEHIEDNQFSSIPQLHVDFS